MLVLLILDRHLGSERTKEATTGGGEAGAGRQAHVLGSHAVLVAEIIALQGQYSLSNEIEAAYVDWSERHAPKDMKEMKDPSSSTECFQELRNKRCLGIVDPPLHELPIVEVFPNSLFFLP